MDRLNLNRQSNRLRMSLSGNVLRTPILRGMATTLLAFLPGILALTGHAAPHSTSAAKGAGSSAGQSRIEAGYGKISLSFEPNQGQTDPSVQFLSRGSGYSLFLTPGEVVLSLERQNSNVSTPPDSQKPAEPLSDTLRMKLVGANVNAAVSGLDPQAGVVSYLIGNDPKKWHPGIHTFGKVNYAQIYPGVDLVFYGNQRQLEYDFVVAPGADASKIAWQIAGAKATVDASGNLQLLATNGPASFKSPVVYQMDGEKRIAVDGAFDVAGNQVRFKLGSYDHGKALIIDPVLSYASYLGGSSTDNIGMNTGFGVSGINNITQAAAVDSKGSLYVTGYTYSPDFPTTNGAYQATAPSRTSSRYPWGFVTKISPDGSSLAYSTYLGGSVWDYSAAIAVDSTFHAYVTGYTASPDFPITPGAYLSFCGQNWEVPPSGLVEVNGCPGMQSAFVTELNPTGTGLVYSTFLDGYGSSEGVAIAVDSAGRAYVTGNETDGCGADQPAFACFPTTGNAIISGAQGGNPSQFPIYISVLDPTGSTLLYSTLFGDLNGINRDPAGSGPTYATAITVDSQNNFYVTANVDGLAVPTTSGVIQPEPNGINTTYNIAESVRGFIAKFTPVTSAGGPKLAYGTYLGGGQNLADSTSGIAVDASGNAYVTGLTQSWDFPVTAGAYQTTCGPGGGDNCASAYVVKLNPTASQILWGTFIGDLNNSAFPGYQGPVNQVGPVQLDGQGNVYITGQSSLGLPLVNPVEPATGAVAQAFVAEFDPTGSQLLFSSLIGTGGSADSEQYPAGMAVDGAGDIYLAGNTFSSLITTPGSFEPNDPSTSYYHGFVAKISTTDTSSTTLAALPSPVPYGQMVTLTATVSGQGISSTPTGTVTFYNGATELGTGTLSGPLATSATASFSTSSLAPGVYSLTASYSGDASFASSASAALSLTVDNQAPTTTSLSPASTTALLPAFTLTVNGTNFSPTSQVLWNGSSLVITSQTPTQLQATVPATGCTVGGMDTVTVFNPTPGGGGSNPQTFTCNNPVPVTTSLSRTIAASGGPAFTLNVYGSKFVSTSTVNWN
ncbi:MAG: SBBP repeat-containing protein, partial [Terracidiphilus sp.]